MVVPSSASFSRACQRFTQPYQAEGPVAFVKNSSSVSTQASVTCNQ